MGGLIKAFKDKNLSGFISDKWKKVTPDIRKKCEIKGKCFVSGTWIWGENIQKPIENISIGELVLSHTLVNKYETRYEESRGRYVFTNVPAADFLASKEQQELDAAGYKGNDFWKISLTLLEKERDNNQIVLLRSEKWMEAKKMCETGNTMWLNAPEMGLHGIAKIESLDFVGKIHVPEKNTAKTYAYSPVTGIFEHDSEEVWQLVFDGCDTVGVTATHPFFSLKRGGWTNAENLYLDEQVLSCGSRGILTNKYRLPGTHRVYNVEVAEWHNFLAGKEGIVVHNGCTEVTSGKLKTKQNGPKLEAEYTNHKGKILKWVEQSEGQIQTAIKNAENSSSVGTQLEVTVAKAIQEKVTKEKMTAFRNKVSREDGNPAGDIDVATTNELIEVKSKVDGDMVKQARKYSDYEDEDFMNPYGKKVIFFIDDKDTKGRVKNKL
jgi:hypothetical protein